MEKLSIHDISSLPSFPPGVYILYIHTIHGIAHNFPYRRFNDHHIQHCKSVYHWNSIMCG